MDTARQLYEQDATGWRRGLYEDVKRTFRAPLVNWIFRTTMAAFDDPPDALAAVIDDVRAFHGLEDGLPSIYRTLAQWPAFFRPLWNDLEGVLRDDAFSTGCADARATVDDYVDSLPYVPQLGPDVIRAQGLEAAAVADLQALFREFNGGAIETVVPALPVYAKTVDVAGQRTIGRDRQR